MDQDTFDDCFTVQGRDVDEVKRRLGTAARGRLLSLAAATTHTVEVLDDRIEVRIDDVIDGSAQLVTILEDLVAAAIEIAPATAATPFR
jgi:hypothetical protein